MASYDQATTKQQPVDMNVDVVVVGGGFSGVQAAWDIQQAGLECLLLEARHRIGGRSYSKQLQSGPGTIDLGAAWINKTTQPKIYATAQRLNLELIEQYTEGDEVWELPDGTTLRSTPDTDGAKRIQELLGPAFSIFAEHADAVDIHQPDQSTLGRDTSVEDWARSLGLDADVGLASLRTMTAALVGRDISEVGVHYLLDYIKSGGGPSDLAGEGKFGAQSLRLKKGTSAIVHGMAGEMKPGSILVDSPVSSIQQHDRDIVVETKSGQKVTCKKVIVAIPTNTYQDIEFSPSLPQDKATLTSSTLPGVYAKVILNYSRPWWREAGLVGKFSSLKGPACVSWDCSDESQQQYSLAFLIGGRFATEWSKLDQAERGRVVIVHLSELVGPDHAHSAKDVLEVNELFWSQLEYIGGAPTAAMGPDMLAKYAKALRQPFGNVHFAGGETAFEWKGYLEGALRAGSRAAEEVLRQIKRGETGV